MVTGWRHDLARPGFLILAPGRGQGRRILAGGMAGRMVWWATTRKAIRPGHSRLARRRRPLWMRPCFRREDFAERNQRIEPRRGFPARPRTGERGPNLSILVNPTEAKQGVGGESRCEPRKTPGPRKQPTSHRSLKPKPSCPEGGPEPQID
jgi:hypothetical protein